MSEITITLRSSDVDGLDFTSLVSKESREALKMHTGYDVNSAVEFAYTQYLMDLFDEFNYKLDIDEGTLELMYGQDGSLDFEFNVNTDITTIFAIHRDVWCKHKQKFTEWLYSEENRKNPIMPTSIKGFFTWLEGDNVDDAVAIYLKYLVHNVVMPLIKQYADEAYIESLNLGLEPIAGSFE